MFPMQRAPLLAALLLAFSGSLYAHTPADDADSTHRIYRPAAKMIPMSAAERQADETRRRTIISNTQNLFTLLGAEIALNQGQTSLALNTYLATLVKTKDPEVAERAMELAVGLNAYDIAEHIYRQWQLLEPEPGPAQRRIAWTRALALGDNEQVINGLESVIEESDVEQTRRIFLLLARIAATNDGLAKKGSRAVAKAAARHPDMTEALIAATLFHSAAGEKQEAVKGLEKLAANDATLTPTTRVALGLIVRNDPELLPEFFKQTDTDKLPQIWQELEVESLIQGQKNEQAYQRLQKLLENRPSADLFIQAAVLSYQQKDHINTTLGYLEKAYRQGTQLQKSRAAVLSSIRLLAEHRHDDAAQWISRISDPETAFDKLVLQISLAAERQQWREALRLAQNTGRISEQQGRFFTGEDLDQLQLFALAQSGQPQQNAAELTRIINRLEKTNGSRDSLAAALYQRGLLYSDKLRQFNRAVADFRHYLRLKPDNSQGMNALGYTLLEKPEYLAEAYELLKKAYRAEPDNAQINDSLGWAYYKKGDYQTALPYLQYAYQQEPDAEVAAHLGETYWALGNQDKAREVWKEAWGRNRKHHVLNATLRKYKIRF